MELTVGTTFTGNRHCFTGRIEVLAVDKPKNELTVNLTFKHETFTSNWTEVWNLQHVIWGFEKGEYYLKEFTDYPQDKQLTFVEPVEHCRYCNETANLYEGCCIECYRKHCI